MVVARAVGRWVIGAAPGLLGSVDGDSGGCAGCGSIGGALGDQSFCGYHIVGGVGQNPKRLVRVHNSKIYLYLRNTA